MDAATCTKFNDTINLKLAQMIRDAYELRELSICKPLGSNQRMDLNSLITILEMQVRRETQETAELMQAAE